MIRLSATLPSTAATGGVGASSPSGQSIDIAALFGANDEGCFYDLNNMSNHKEDIAGTTAAEIDGPVGKILDSGKSNDMVALSDTVRATLRRKAKNTAQRNVQRNTETTSLFVQVANASQAVGTESSPLNYQSRNVHTITTTATGLQYAALAGRTSSGTNMTVSFYVKISATGTPDLEALYLYNANGIGSVLVNFTNETVTQQNNDLVSGSVTAVSGHTGWYRVVYTIPRHGDALYLIPTDGAANLNGVAVGNTFKLQGFQVEMGSSATDYQRVYSNISYDEYGIANVNYLSFSSDAYTAQNLVHDSANVTMFARTGNQDNSSTVKPIFSVGVNSSDNSYRLAVENANYVAQVGASTNTKATGSVPSNISGVRAEYVNNTDNLKLYINGTLASNKTLSASSRDFGLYNEAALGGQLATEGSSPTVNSTLNHDLYSFVLFTDTLTDTQKLNIEYTLSQQSGVS